MRFHSQGSIDIRGNSQPTAHSRESLRQFYFYQNTFRNSDKSKRHALEKNIYQNSLQVALTAQTTDSVTFLIQYSL